MNCINLKERFGGRYRIGRDPSYHVEHGEHGRADDPWTMILLCQHGHVYPHGGDLLGAATDKLGGVARALMALPCCTVAQDGDDGVNVTFHVDDFRQVANLLKPRRRRQISEAERERLASLSAQHGFQARNASLTMANRTPGRDLSGNPGSDSPKRSDAALTPS